MFVLSILFGAIVGFSLGLTGGGGTIFAVPLLVYGLGVEPREAVGISLASVGVMAVVGLLGRWRSREFEGRPGLIFAAAGMLGAPLGTWLASLLAPSLLLLLFAVLMLAVAARMWLVVPAVDMLLMDDADVAADGPTCRRDHVGNLMITSKCALLLLSVGVLTGLLSGLFGVGGGFVIVPALIMFSGMSIHRAVGTSMLVIAMISIAGVTAQVWSGRSIALDTTLLFILGGVGGLGLGTLSSRRLSGRALQRSFAAAIVAVAIFVIVRSLYQPN